jgi:hypothetical protein
MLLPHPESDLTLNIFVLGSEVITALKGKKDFTLIENIMRDFLKKSEKRSPDLFFDVLTFLYAVGFLDYKGYKMRLKKHDTSEPRLF